MTKDDYLNKLVLIAFRMDEKAERMHERTKRLQRMASLAKMGMKDSREFIELEKEFMQPRVTDFGDEMNDLQRVVKKLKKYKWDHK